MAVTTADGRLTWYGLTLSAGFGDVGEPTLVNGILGDVGVAAPVACSDPDVVPVTRRSRQGGRLVFVFNTAPEARTVSLTPALADLEGIGASQGAGDQCSGEARSRSRSPNGASASST